MTVMKKTVLFYMSLETGMTFPVITKPGLFVRGQLVGTTEKQSSESLYVKSLVNIARGCLLQIICQLQIMDAKGHH